MSRSAITIMGLNFLPDLELRMETSCSLKEARYAIGKCLRHPGATCLPSGTTVGSIKGNEFSLHFKKPNRNFWRPEFGGRFSVVNNRVRIVVSCGFSNEARAGTALLWTACGLGLVLALDKFTHGGMNIPDFIGACIGLASVFAGPCLALWSEFRDDRIQMKTILDGVGK